ncbi:UNVERIFIED_CONTAM: hypothetical protein H355_008837 [Colinus virginianus]|nr:hypothetical protein H355_008837 [Colinus virginianus]
MDGEGKSRVSAELSDASEADSFLDPAYQPLKVFLRVRPFSVAELENHDPQVFGPETTQSEFFEGSTKEIIRAYISGVNGLVFTYGVTNAGKTYTIQGTSKDFGILPRSLDMIFNHIRGRQYLKMNFKPCLSNDVKKLEDAQVKQEEAIKTTLLASLKEVIQTVLPKSLGYFPPKLVGGDGKPVVHFDANTSVDDFPDSNETSAEEEVDITILSHEDLLRTAENLKEKLIAERQSKLLLEVNIRREMAEAMFRQLLETEEAWRQVILQSY